MPDELDDERVRQLFQSLAGPPVDTEAALRAVHAGKGRVGWVRRVAPLSVAAAAASLVAVVLVRAGRDSDDDVVPAGPSTERPGSTAPPVTSPAVTPSVPPSTLPATTTVPVTTVPVPTPAPTAPPTAAAAPPLAGPAPPLALARQYRCPGGAVTVRATSAGLVLVSAEPDPGFRVVDESVISDRVEVVFAGGPGGGGSDDHGDDDGGEGGGSGSGDDGDDDSGGPDVGDEREVRVRLEDGELQHECRD